MDDRNQQGKTGGNLDSQNFTDDQLQDFIDNPDMKGGYFNNGVYDLNSKQGQALHSRGFIDNNGRPIEGKTGSTRKNDDVSESRR